MENNNSDLTEDKTDELIEDREQQKKLVHPYRKYQIYVLLSFILTIIFTTILYRQNKKLQEYIKQKDISLSTLQNIDLQSNGIKQLLDLVDVNYLINNLDKNKNIHTIKKPNEIYFLSSLISDSNEITYKLCYQSSTDGQNPKIFFDNCAKFSPLVFLIETNDGYRFGVFISIFLGGDFGEKNFYLRDDNAFIFSFNTFKKYEIKKSYEDYAVYYRKNKFPWFGKRDIYIGDYFSENANSFCEFPTAYKKNDDDIGEYILNGGIKKFVIKELEVLAPYIWQK